MSDAANDAARRQRGKVFKRLVLDQSIPHGAVRLFILLYTHSKNGRCFPGQRLLRRELGCSMASLKPWIEALKKGGYMTTTETVSKNGLLTIYSLNLGVFPVSVTPGVSGFEPGVSGFVGGVSGFSNRTNSSEVNPQGTKERKSSW
jgi:hypothetical protein